ncbi:MAG: hypothetical protein QM500_19880 [Methylococcales bacterium]
MSDSTCIENEEVNILPENFTHQQLHDACLNYSHNYGLMDKTEQDDIRFKAKEWLKAWHKALAV